MDLQKEEQEVSLYKVLDDFVPKSVLSSKNKAKSWKYGYDPKYDIIVISKDGTVGEIISIQGLVVALPKEPSKPFSRSKKKPEQYWERQDIPKELSKIKSIFQWNEMYSYF